MTIDGSEYKFFTAESAQSGRRGRGDKLLIPGPTATVIKFMP